MHITIGLLWPTTKMNATDMQGRRCASAMIGRGKEYSSHARSQEELGPVAPTTVGWSKMFGRV